jgi:anti-sigma-K factor RskA
MTMLNEDDIALAGEYVLGLLDAADEAASAARIATDADFAAEVDAWRLRLQPMVDGNDTPAPAHIWSIINSALPHPTGQDTGRSSVRIWQMLTGISATAAAVLAVILLQQPVPLTPPKPETPLVAALGSETGQASITARYDASNGQMLLTPVSLDTGKLYPELWVVPADGKARSLGIVRGDVPSEININTEMRDFLNEGATLAITPEPAGGAPGGKATGPIIASGKITTV